MAHELTIVTFLFAIWRQLVVGIVGTPYGLRVLFCALGALALVIESILIQCTGSWRVAEPPRLGGWKWHTLFFWLPFQWLQ